MAVLVVDADGVIVRASSRFRTLLGYEADAVLGRPVVTFVDAADRVIVEGYLANPSAAAVDAFLPLRMVAADGSTAAVDASIQSMGNEPSAGLVMAFAPSAASEAVREELQAADRLRLIDEMKHRMLESASHELRTPLTTAAGWGQMLERYAERLTVEQLVNIGASLTRAATRMHRVVDDLTDLDGAARGTLAAHRRAVDLSGLVLDIADAVDLGPRMLEMDVASGVVAEVEPRMYRRIVEALLTNVARHTPPQTQVWLSLRSSDGRAVLEVADDGPGLPVVFGEDVFSPFIQGAFLLDAANPGLGVGLTLVRRFAELHDGTCSAGSREPCGTRVQVAIPLRSRTHVEASDVQAIIDVARRYEQQTSARAAGPVRLRPEAARIVSGLLRTARHKLAMDVAYLNVFNATDQLIVAAEGNGASIGITEGAVIPIQETYCARMLRGEIDNVVPDAAAHPLLADLPPTQAGIACYVGVPVRLPTGQVLGSLCCAAERPRPDLTSSDLSHLEAIADVLGDAIARTDLVDGVDLEVTRRIEDVLARPGALRIEYQPVVALSDGHVAGVEALARFTDTPLRPPDLWFAEAAVVGLEAQLEQVAVARALHGLPHLPDDCYLALNFSPATIVNGGLRPLLGRIPLHRLVIEVTEHAVIDDYERLRAAMGPFTDAGTRLAIDDVGSGYASLRHVARLAPDILKIDRSMVSRLTTDPTERAVLRALVELAHHLGAPLIAEGVEDADTARLLTDVGVTHAQGWYFARPGPLPLPRSSYDTP